MTTGRPVSVAGVLAGTTGAQVAAIMAATSVPALAPKLGPELGVNPSLIGYQVSLVYASGMVSASLAPGILRRWGACRATQAFLVTSAAGALLATVPSLWVLLLASVALGFGLGGLAPCATHLLSRFTPPERRNLYFSLKQTGVPGGGMAAALIAPPIALAWGWRWALAAAACSAIVVALLLGLERRRWDDDRDPTAPVAPNPIGGLRLAWDVLPIRYVSLKGFCYAFVQLCITTFLVTMLVVEFGYSLVRAGVMLSVVQVSGVTGRILWARVADHCRSAHGVLLAMNAIMLACCAAIATFGLGHAPALVTLLCVALGISAVGWNGLFLAEVARLAPPGKAGAATGGAMVFNFGGILVGPAAFSACYGLTGSYASTFWLLAAVSVAGYAFLRLAIRLDRVH